MGLYLKKSFSYGPFRFNLSKSGLGLSTGITGARIGVGPRGMMVHAGRGGLYYRKSVGGSKARRTVSGTGEAGSLIGLAFGATILFSLAGFQDSDGWTALFAIPGFFILWRISSTLVERRRHAKEWKKIEAVLNLLRAAFIDPTLMPVEIDEQVKAIKQARTIVVRLEHPGTIQHRHRPCRLRS